MSQPRLIRVHPSDNVAVALQTLAAGSSVSFEGQTLPLSAEVPPGFTGDVAAALETIRLYGARAALDAHLDTSANR